MTLKEIQDKLRTMKSGYLEKWSYPYKLVPADIDKILDSFGVEEQIGEIWNGCDLDFHASFIFENESYSAWGSAYTGSMCIEKV